MDRRTFISTAGIGGAAAALAAPALAQGAAKVQWRLTSSYPKSLDTLFGISEGLAERVAALTDGNFTIQVFAPGEIVPPLQALEAAGAGTVECAHSLGSFNIGKDPTFAFDTSLPFGLNTRQHNAWLYQGGGRALMNEFLAGYNVYAIPSGNTGAQMGGWYRKEINSLADLNGLKLRIAGLGGNILSRLGVVPQQIGGGDIYAALEKGTIDAAEFSGPYDDEKLGFVKVAPYYYAPGWWEGTANVGLFINLDKWNSLPPAYQAALEAASSATMIDCLAKYDARNPEAVYKLVAQGAQLRTFPDEVMQAAYVEAYKMYDEIAGSNEAFRKIYEPWKAFAEKARAWNRVCELPFDYFLATKINQTTGAKPSP